MNFLQQIVGQVHAAAGDAPMARPKGRVPPVADAAGADPTAPEPVRSAPLPGQPVTEPAMPPAAPWAPPRHQRVEPVAPPVDGVSAVPMTVRSEEAATTPLPAADAGMSSDLPPPPQGPATTSDPVPGNDTPASALDAPLAQPSEPPVTAPPEKREAEVVAEPPLSEGSPVVAAAAEETVSADQGQRDSLGAATLPDVIAPVAEPHPLPSIEAVTKGEATAQTEPAPAARPRPDIAVEEPQEIAPRQPNAALPLAQPLQSLEAMRQETDWQKQPAPPPAPDQPQLQIDQIDVVVSEPQSQRPTGTARPAPLAAVSASRRYLRRL